MSDGPPPAKRRKYVLRSSATPLLGFRGKNPTNGFPHRYDLTRSFDVLVGQKPDQQRFSVYHDLLTQRSEFFRAARSERWSHDPTKPTTLDDVDVEVFSAYLHCVNWGSEGLSSLVQPMLEEINVCQGETINTVVTSSTEDSNNNRHISHDKSISSSSDDDDDDDDDKGTEEENKTHSPSFSLEPVEKFLIDLYLLADKLIDPTTANLAIEKLIVLVEDRGMYLSKALIEFVYGATTAGSPLRRYIRDHSFIADPSIANDVEEHQTEGFPFDLIKDILLEMFVINRNNLDGKIGDVYSYMRLQPHDYHQAVDKDSAPRRSCNCSKKRGVKVEASRKYAE